MKEEKAILEFKEEYRFLSNTYNCPVSYKGLTFPNAEAAFQAQKCATEEEKLKYTKTDDQAFTDLMKKEPDDYVATDPKFRHLMYEILLAKFANPELQQKLLSTGYRDLIYENTYHDNIWGNCTCEKCRDKEGLNRLGIKLMMVRNHYRDEKEWKNSFEKPWEEILDTFQDYRCVDMDSLKHLIAFTYDECEMRLATATYFPWHYLTVYKYVSQASYFLRMNYLPFIPHSKSAALEDFISGLCYEIENGFYNGDSNLEHPLHLDTTRHTPAGCSGRQADMSSYESFLKAFDDDVEYLKTIGYE